MQALRDRGENIPPEDLMQVAKEIKEKYAYCCKSGDLLAEFKEFDEKPEKKFKTYTGTNSMNGEVF